MRGQAVRRALMMGALAVVFLMCPAGPTMPYPGWARGWQPLPVSEQECINRVNRAFDDEGFSGRAEGPHHVTAVKGSFVFMVACVDVGGGRSEAVVFAATDQNSNAVPLGEQRDRLLARIAGTFQAGGAAQAGAAGASDPSGYISKGGCRAPPDQFQTFTGPRANGMLLDICGTAAYAAMIQTDEQRCHFASINASAQVFCNSQGFSFACDVKEESESRSPTFRLGDYTRCDGPRCHGLTEIVCMGRVRPVPLTATPPASQGGTTPSGTAPATTASTTPAAGTTPAAPGGATTVNPPKSELYPPEHTYADPKTDTGKSVDWCQFPGTNCGQGGADLFCQNMGFTRASSFEAVQTSPTYVAGAKWECPAGAACYALKNVKCEGRTGPRTSAPPTVMSTSQPPPPPPARDISSPPSAPRTAPQSFYNPQLNGIAVDHCAQWGADCGQGGADLYCRAMGFGRATAFQEGYSNPTYVQGTGQVCREAGCVALTQVTCDPAPTQSRTYAEPKIGVAWVDACAHWAVDCGQGGADLFCRAQGYARASAYHLGNRNPTWVQGDSRMCQQEGCTALTDVTCVN